MRATVFCCRQVTKPVAGPKPVAGSKPLPPGACTIPDPLDDPPKLVRCPGLVAAPTQPLPDKRDCNPIWQCTYCKAPADTLPASRRDGGVAAKCREATAAKRDAKEATKAKCVGKGTEAKRTVGTQADGKTAKNPDCPTDNKAPSGQTSKRAKKTDESLLAL